MVGSWALLPLVGIPPGSSRWSVSASPSSGPWRSPCRPFDRPCATASAFAGSSRRLGCAPKPLGAVGHVRSDSIGSMSTTASSRSAGRPIGPRSRRLPSPRPRCLLRPHRRHRLPWRLRHHRLRPQPPPLRPLGHRASQPCSPPHRPWRPPPRRTYSQPPMSGPLFAGLVAMAATQGHPCSPRGQRQARASSGARRSAVATRR